MLSSGVEHSSLPVDFEATISRVSALPILRKMSYLKKINIQMTQYFGMVSIDIII